jgi:hypothetical protein
MGILVSALASLYATHTVPNTGSITAVGVGVYSDINCVNPLSSIGWGTLNPGSTTNYTMYVKNTGDAQETLNMTTSSWNPGTASSYITLKWNQEKSILSAGASVPAVLTLTVSPSITGITSFSFNITITGTH